MGRGLFMVKVKVRVYSPLSYEAQQTFTCDKFTEAIINFVFSSMKVIVIVIEYKMM